MAGEQAGSRDINLSTHPQASSAELHEGFMLSRGNENVAIKLRAILEVELASVPSEMKR